MTKHSPIIRVGLGNVGGHGQSKRAKAKRIQKLNVASFGINEGDGIIRHFNNPRFRLFHAVTGRMRRGFLDTPILLKRRWTYLGFYTERISNRVLRAIRVAPDRHVTVVKYQHPVGKVAHVNVHLNAGPKQLNGWDPAAGIVREYQRSVDNLDRLLADLRREPESWLIVVTGDMNMRVGTARPWSVHPVLRRHGLKVYTRGYDCIAVDERFEMLRLRVIPEHVTGADHPWLVARMRRR